MTAGNTTWWCLQCQVSVQPEKPLWHRMTEEEALCCAVQDLTLPLISLFTGRGFDAVIQETFESGPQRIEDLWLRQISIPHPQFSAGATDSHMAIVR